MGENQKEVFNLAPSGVKLSDNYLLTETNVLQNYEKTCKD
jgi:hypothetical protein